MITFSASASPSEGSLAESSSRSCALRISTILWLSAAALEVLRQQRDPEFSDDELEFYSDDEDNPLVKAAKIGRTEDVVWSALQTSQRRSTG